MQQRRHPSGVRREQLYGSVELLSTTEQDSQKRSIGRFRLEPSSAPQPVSLCLMICIFQTFLFHLLNYTANFIQKCAFIRNTHSSTTIDVFIRNTHSSTTIEQVSFPMSRK